MYSLWELDGRAESAIKLYKYANHEQLAAFFAAKLALRFPDIHADLVIAIPSSLATLRSRGFNHTSAIARRFARLTSIPFSATALYPRRNRSFQASLMVEERDRNVENAFIGSPTKVRGRCIILIEDVITSGATVREACRELRRVGASSITVLSLARSKRFNRYRVERGLRLIKSSFIRDDFHASNST